jgi:hypothetical protein
VVALGRLGAPPDEVGDMVRVGSNGDGLRVYSTGGLWSLLLVAYAGTAN